MARLRPTQPRGNTMTQLEQPCLEVPFDEVEKWEKIQGSCARFYAAAEWGYKQALATPPPEPPTVMEIIELSTVIDDAGLGIVIELSTVIDDAGLGIVEFARAALERWGQR